MNFESFDINAVSGFQWDKGNIEKNKKKHNLYKWQIEEVFRWYAFGKTDNEIELMVVFTVRNNLLRVISARKMNQKERADFEKI